MLRRYTNALFQEILKSGIDPTLFEADDNGDDGDHPGFEVRLKGSDLWFLTRNPKGDFDEFDYQFTEFAAGYPWTDIRPDQGYAPFETVLSVFREWLATDVAPHLEDEALPDLWVQINEARTMLSAVAQPGVDEEFTGDEKTQLRIALQQFKLLVFKEFEPAVEEKAVIEQQLDRLAESVDRLNKFDWQGVALNTVISIGITLSLDTEKGRVLFGLFQQALSYAIHLIK
jgi:hypothetical protein